MGRYFALIGMALGVGVGIILTMVGFAAGPWVLMVAVPFTLLGIYDVLQARQQLSDYLAYALGFRRHPT